MTNLKNIELAREHAGGAEPIVGEAGPGERGERGERVQERPRIDGLGSAGT